MPITPGTPEVRCQPASLEVVDHSRSTELPSPEQNRTAISDLDTHHCRNRAQHLEELVSWTSR
jgi:hypothetical protein